MVIYGWKGGPHLTNATAIHQVNGPFLHKYSTSTILLSKFVSQYSTRKINKLDFIDLRFVFLKKISFTFLNQIKKVELCFLCILGMKS